MVDNLLDQTMNLLLQIQSLQLLIFFMNDQEFMVNLDYFLFFCFFTFNDFCIVFFKLLHLISSFSLTKSLLVSYAYVSIKSIDCIILSSSELKAILLISSVKTLCLSLLNLCSVSK